MSRLSHHARWGGHLWFTGHLKRTKDGKWQCLMHPHARLVHPRYSSWVCPECYEPVTRKQGRKTYTYWVRRLPERRPELRMHRTRPARDQEEA